MAGVIAKTFTIRTITPACSAAKKYFQNALWKEKWFPVVDAVECFLACDPTGLYIGDLNGRPVAISGIFKHEENYRSAGCYIVDEAYRGEEYGLRIAEEALERSLPIDIFSFYAVPQMTSKYEKYFGCEQRWLSQRHMVDVTKALPVLDDAPDVMLAIKRVDEVNLEALCNYDAAMFGYRRDKFIERWLHGSYTRIAVDTDQTIVGYAVAKPVYSQENCYRIGPVFGGSLETAKSLLKEIFKEINEFGQRIEPVAVLDIPVGVNPNANELARILGGNVLSSSTHACISIICRSRSLSVLTNIFSCHSKF